jgi:hypothetical protein
MLLLWQRGERERKKRKETHIYAREEEKERLYSTAALLALRYTTGVEIQGWPRSTAWQMQSARARLANAQLYCAMR